MAKHGDTGETIALADEAADEHKGRRVAGQDPIKRGQILDGAHRVFMRQGFDAASMNDITREAGVSKGTIYVYFDNKEELFSALLDRERSKLFQTMSEALNNHATPRKALTRYGTLLAKKLTSAEVLRAQRMVLGVMERMPALAAQFYDAGPSSGQKILGNYFKQEIAAGRLAMPDVDLATQQFGDLCMSGLFRPCLFGARHTSPSAEEIARSVDSAVEMFLCAYGTDRTETGRTE
jgi:AcrR family transcriptional regulator